MPHLTGQWSHQVSSQWLPLSSCTGSTVWACIGPTSPGMWTVVALMLSYGIPPQSERKTKSEIEKHHKIQKENHYKDTSRETEQKLH